MSRLFFVDTSYIVALASADDQYHRVAEQVRLSLTNNDKFYYTEAIMYESLNALAKQKTRQWGITFFEQMQKHPNATLLHTTPAQFHAALELYRHYADKEWGLVDCVSFLTMKGKRIKYALTADQHFEQAGLIAVLRSPEKVK